MSTIVQTRRNWRQQYKHTYKEVFTIHLIGPSGFLIRMVLIMPFLDKQRQPYSWPFAYTLCLLEFSGFTFWAMMVGRWRRMFLCEIAFWSKKITGGWSGLYCSERKFNLQGNHRDVGPLFLSSSLLPSLETHPVSTACIYSTSQHDGVLFRVHKHNESDNFMCFQLWF